MTAAAALAFAVAHWRKLLLVASYVVALALGWWLHKPPAPVTCPPAIHEVASSTSSTVASSQQSSETKEGKRRTVQITFKPAPAGAAAPAAAIKVPGVALPITMPPGEVVDSETFEVDGPKVTDTKAATETQATEDHHLDLQLKPQPLAAAADLPRFSVFWEPRIRPDFGIGIVGAGIRVTTNWWIEGWAEPTAPAFGAGVRYTH